MIPFPNLMNHQIVRPFLAILLPIPDWWSLLGLSSHCDGDLVLWCFVKLRTQKTWLNKKCCIKDISDVQDQFSWTLWHLNFAAVVEKVEEKKERIRNGCRVLDKSDKCIYLCGCLQALAISRSIQNIWHHVRHRCQLGWYEKTIEVLQYTNLLEYFVHINMTLRTVNVFQFLRISQSPWKGTVLFSHIKLLQTLNSQAVIGPHQAAWMQHTPGTTLICSPRSWRNIRVLEPSCLMIWHRQCSLKGSLLFCPLGWKLETPGVEPWMVQGEKCLVIWLGDFWEMEFLIKRCDK